MFKKWSLLLKENSSRGFSLVEILVALTLLAIAGTFVVGKIFDQLHEGKVNSARIQMNALADRLKEFRRHCGFYPTTDQGLEALISPPSGRECKQYNPGGYIESGTLPMDPWDYPYEYFNQNGEINIVSRGNGGLPGGENEEADIWLYENRKPTGDE